MHKHVVADPGVRLNVPFRTNGFGACRPKLIVWFALLIVMFLVWLASTGAAFQSLLPGCDATMVQGPGPAATIVTVVPTPRPLVHTAGVVD